MILDTMSVVVVDDAITYPPILIVYVEHQTDNPVVWLF